MSFKYILQVSPGSQVLLDNAERYGHHLARSLNDSNSSQVLSRKNIGTMCSVCIVAICNVDTSFIHY